MTMNLRQILNEAFVANKIHAELVRLRSEGVDRETLMAELKAYHDELESEADQDLILDTLDCFYGLVYPQFFRVTTAQAARLTGRA